MAFDFLADLEILLPILIRSLICSEQYGISWFLNVNGLDSDEDKGSNCMPFNYEI